MNYSRFGSTRSEASVTEDPPLPQGLSAGDHGAGRRRRILLLGAFASLLIVACGISVAFVVRNRAREPSAGLRKPSEAISKACRATQYPGVCIASLMDFPGAMDAAEGDLVHMSVNVTLQRVDRALYDASGIVNVKMDRLARSAYGDCLDLLDHTIEQLTHSLAAVSGGADGVAIGASDADVLTWLSGALTNQDTCTESLEMLPKGYVKDQMSSYMKDLTELVSNSLALFAASRNNDFSGIPIENRRRKLLESESATAGIDGLFPWWLSTKDRRLLEVPASGIQADIVVAKDGSGTYRTIGEAVKAAPENSPHRIIIYIKAGRYEENIKVARKKKNLMFVGDGMGQTLVTGWRSVYDKYTTFHTATFAATGTGFIARDITFENTAGPSKHQAVALRVGADHAVVYRCAIVGFQDSFYVHSQRQFVRECDISGTVDFIFGNAAVVLQNTTIRARKPMDMQKNTITAQNRKDPNQNTGISIHACQVVPAEDLKGVIGQYPTFLGRPWKMYARTVYMLSYLDEHIHSAGWLEWNGQFALDTLYYGEYMNYGPGAGVGKRVNWPGYRVITLAEEASKFTVAQFIYGTSWLPSTGVAFVAGLNV